VETGKSNPGEAFTAKIELKTLDTLSLNLTHPHRIKLVLENDKFTWLTTKCTNTLYGVASTNKSVTSPTVTPTSCTIN
jgi:hypothetical protein